MAKNIEVPEVQEEIPALGPEIVEPVVTEEKPQVQIVNESLTNKTATGYEPSEEL